MRPSLSHRERTALAWTEALMKFSEHLVTPELEAELREHFDDKKLVGLIQAIPLIPGHPPH